MARPTEDFNLTYRNQGGDTHLEISGTADDCAQAAMYLLCQVCAQFGETPEACQLIRLNIMRTLDRVGEEVVQMLFDENHAEEEVQDGQS